MAANVWTCFDCNKQFASHTFMKEIPSKVLVSYGDETDKDGNALIRSLGVVAYKSVCIDCHKSDALLTDEHIKLNNGAVYYPNTVEWSLFCIKYIGITDGESFGSCKDRYNKWIPFSNTDGFEWFTYGKYRSIPVWNYFKDKICKDKESVPEMKSVPDEVPEYDRRGGSYDAPELQMIMDFIEKNKIDTTSKLREEFKKLGLSEIMKEAGFAYRSPVSYESAYVIPHIYLCTTYIFTLYIPL